MAEDCGFRYLLLTTKHHDGFCLWDTAYTDYKVTAEDCPFHENEHADIVKSMFDAFREKGIGIGAYFSKADWHCQDYWNPELRKDGLTSRGPSYDPKDHPGNVEPFPGVHEESGSGALQELRKTRYPLVRRRLGMQG